MSIINEIWNKSAISISGRHFDTSKESSNPKFLSDNTNLLHICATCSELPSYISPMERARKAPHRNSCAVENSCYQWIRPCIPSPHWLERRRLPDPKHHVTTKLICQIFGYNRDDEVIVRSVFRLGGGVLDITHPSRIL